MKKQKVMSLTQFKALRDGTLVSRQRMATLVAERFQIGRNLVVAATTESMIDAWRKNKPDLLVRRDGSSLQAPAKSSECAKLRDVMEQIQQLVEGFDRDTEGVKFAHSAEKLIDRIELLADRALAKR